MQRVICGKNDLYVVAREGMGYAVFRKIKEYGFWQQISKWYVYEKAAITKYQKIIGGKK